MAVLVVDLAVVEEPVEDLVLVEAEEAALEPAVAPEAALVVLEVVPEVAVVAVAVLVAVTVAVAATRLFRPGHLSLHC